jgi:hypothetical protein
MSVSGIGSITSSAAAAQLRRLQELTAAENTGLAGGASAATPASTTPGNGRDTFRSDFSALVSAVQSGDMSGAQSALTALQSDRAAMGAQGGRGPGQDSSKMSNDLAALVQAVQSGDVAGAQKALQTIQSNMQAHHGHHHHSHGGAMVTTTVAPTQDPLVPAPGNSSDRDNDGDSR